MKKNLMFHCVPQRAYIQVHDCMELRARPIGKAPLGSQPRLRACELCTLYPLVEAGKVPTVSLEDYLAGKRPEPVEAPRADNEKSAPAAAEAAAGSTVG